MCMQISLYVLSQCAMDMSGIKGTWFHFYFECQVGSLYHIAFWSGSSLPTRFKNTQETA